MAPVKPGDVVELEISGRGKKGDAVAKVRGFVVFVKPKESELERGTKVKAKILVVKERFAVAQEI